MPDGENECQPPDAFTTWIDQQWADGVKLAAERMRRAEAITDPAIRESAMGQGSIVVEDWRSIVVED